MVLKVVLKTSSENCSKFSGVSSCLSCSPDLLQCFEISKLKENVSYFSSSEFMAADRSEVIGNV